MFFLTTFFPIIAILSLTFELNEMSMTVFQSYIDNTMITTLG